VSYQLLSREKEPIYARRVAAQLAQVSIEFLQVCEQEGLMQRAAKREGGGGYSLSDIRRLAQIHSLREQLGWDLAPGRAVRRMRRRLLELMAQMEAMEQRMVQRERALLEEIEQLRRRLER